MAIEERSTTTLQREDMTSVLGNTLMPGAVEEAGDIPASEVNGIDELEPDSLGTEFPTGNTAGNIGSFPIVLPNSPTFRVPANPLLPPEYSEILDYTALQYLNGIYRTQIGKFVRVQQLVGSDTLEEYDGFLIGVGINYIILQDYSSGNIRIIDIYSIKSMYVYYTEMTNPFTASNF